MDIHKLSYYSASVSFGLGSFIFILFQLSRLDTLIGLGLLFIFLATILNGLLFLILLVEMTKQSSNKRQCVTSTFMIIVNILITIIYLSMITVM
ncbi:MAG: hypothetical protein ACI9N1_001232 [Flavobacteriales bacterium]|jgi:hypothetical protein